MRFWFWFWTRTFGSSVSYWFWSRAKKSSFSTALLKTGLKLSSKKL
jgi:hypothetical protein